MDHLIRDARRILGSFIKEARKARQLSQQDVADKVGLNNMTISKIESGKFNFGIDTLNKLSIALDFRLELIINDEISSDIRFDLIQNGKTCFIRDFKTGLGIEFEQGNFNKSKKIHHPTSPIILGSELATIMKLMSEWIYKEYPELL